MRLSLPFLFVVSAIFVDSAMVADAAEPSAKVTPGFNEQVQPYFNAHCVRCHGDKKQEGDLRLDQLSRDFQSGADANRWHDLLERVSAGEMPPEDEPQPKAEESARVAEWIAARLKEGKEVRMAKRAPVSFHKLTREEYVHTVHDLLGVHYDAADPTGLPEDPDYHGFERIGSVLSLSPSHVEKYFAAAEAVLAEAFPETTVAPIYAKKDAWDLRSPGFTRTQLEEQGLLDKLRVEVWPGHDLQGGRPGPGTALPMSGYYRVRIQVSGLKPKNGRAPHLTFYVTNLDRLVYETDVVTKEFEPTIVEFMCHLPAGNHSYRVTNDVPGPSTLPRSGRAGRKPFFSIADGREPWQLKLTDDAGEPIIPFLILDWIEWEGPFADVGATAARWNYLPTHEGNFDQVRECFARFTEKAFRRPVPAAEVEQYVKLVEAEIATGEPFYAAVKTGLLAVLCAKDFLYLVEGSPTAKSDQLNDWELASRLSYFLWSTMPDDELMDLARRGKLHEPKVLSEQVKRMLADERSARFADAFPRQWLQLRQVGMFPPDKKLYPNYDDYLETSMIAETTAFFGEVLKQNLTLREFIDSDWTIMNARLGVHYQRSDVTEDRMQRVSLAADDHRGGLLTQASILCLTSDGTRHRPVHRGKWVLESILGKSPPPPPANVPAIEPAEPTAPKATLRAKLDSHKANASCAACHRKIDPLGLAFDNYDAIGRWRTEEVVSDGVGANPQIDASGELPDGRKFADAAEFKALLLQDLDKFNGAFVEKLATFALRRTTTIDDRDDLAAIAAASRKADYRLAAIVEALVTSDLFQQR